LVNNDERTVDCTYDYPFCGLEVINKPNPRDILKKLDLASSSSSSDEKVGYGKDFCVGKKNLEDIVDKKVQAA